jgi:hypothetical protein
MIACRMPGLHRFVAAEGDSTLASPVPPLKARQANEATTAPVTRLLIVFLGLDMTAIRIVLAVTPDPSQGRSNPV